MNVVHILPWLEAPDHPPLSGAEYHLLTLLPVQRQAGLVVELVLLVLQGGSVLEQTARDLRRQGIIVHTLDCFPLRQIPMLPVAWFGSMQQLYHFLVRRRDAVIHMHLEYAANVGRLIAWLAGCRKLVITTHGTTQRESPILQHIFRILEHIPTAHIGISNAVRNFLIKDLRVPQERITVIYYGLSPSSALEQRVVRQMLDLPEDRCIIGFVGRLAPEKQIHLLIDALAHLPEALGVIIGEGELRAALEARVAQHQMHNIRFLGYQPQATRLMPAFDLLCLPSAWEGLGLVLVEAMLQGVPVCGSRAGAIPEVLDNGNAGLLTAPDGSDLVAVLQHAMAHPELLAELAARGREYALRQFTVAAMMQQTLVVYDRVSRR